MEKYDYENAVREDIRTWIENNKEELKDKNFTDTDEIYQYTYDELFVNDGVTGNASGSYFCNAWKAEECLCHNLDLLGDACSEFGDTSCDILKDGAESCDVTIRCYLLGQVLMDIIEEYEDELITEDEDEDEEDED